MARVFLYLYSIVPLPYSRSVTSIWSDATIVLANYVLYSILVPDMPENERGKEQDRLKDIAGKFAGIMEKIKAMRSKYSIQ